MDVHFRLRTFLSLVLLAAVLAMPSTAAAQALTATLTGIVFDPSKAVVPGAEISLINEASGNPRRTVTNDQGYFSISGILPGSYTLNVEAPGFARWERKGITFSAADSRSVSDIILQVGSTTDQVTVTATVQQITPVDSGEKAVVIDQKILQNVAVVGRSAAEFIKILPGMAMISAGVENRPTFTGEVIGINGNGDGGDQSALGNFAANGTRPEALDITADGAHVSDPGCNCATPVNPNTDMIEEFKVQQSGFSAENSKGPVVMSSITKAGGRDFHGSGYIYWRDFKMNANDWLYNANKQVEPQNKFMFPGFTIGGPLLIPGTDFNKNRDKLFFFTGYEYFKQTIDTGLLRSVVPTEEMKNGNFSNTAYLTALGRAAASAANPVAGGSIPQSQIDPGMRAIMKTFPAPNRDPAQFGGYNWIDSLVLDQNMHQWLSRVDYNISDNTKLFVRYNLQTELQPFPVQLWWRNAGAIPLPTPIEGKNRTDSISTNFTQVLTPTLTNEFVFGYTFVDFPNEYRDYSKMKRSTIGYPYKGIFKQDDKIPGFVVWGEPVATMWLTGGFDPVLFATKHLFTVNDNIAKVIGTHTLKFGGYYGYIVNKQPGNEPSAGVLQYATWHGGSTGNVLADMVKGMVASYSEQSLQAVRDEAWKEFAFYVQDTWKATPRLTLDLGMRFQHMTPWTARNEFGMAAWVPSRYSATAPASSFPGILWYGKDKNIPKSGWQTKALYLGPRLGFAFDLFGGGKTVLRGGAGAFVYHDAQLGADAMDLPAGVRSTGACCSLLLPDIDKIADLGSLVFGGNTVGYEDKEQPTNYNWNLTLSHRLPGRQLFEVSYVGGHSSNLTLQDALRNINQVRLGAMLNDPDGDTNAYRPMKQYQDLNVTRHEAYSNYHSLQTTLAKQAGIFNYTLAYTWSKALGIVNSPTDGLVRDNNYGPLSFDRRHLVAASYVLNVPDAVKGDNAFAKAIANGWQITGIVQMASGVNLQRNASNNFNMRAFRPDGQTMDAVDILGTNAITAMPILRCDPRANLGEGQYINGGCFMPPVAGVGGKPGVNGTLVFPGLYGPGFFNTDLSVFKNVRITEGKSIQFRASAYNVANHPNRSFVNGDQNLNLTFDRNGRLQNTRFGYADSKVGRRIVQLALKFYF